MICSSTGTVMVKVKGKRMDLVLYKDLMATDMTVLLNLLQKRVFNCQLPFLILKVLQDMPSFDQKSILNSRSSSCEAMG